MISVGITIVFPKIVNAAKDVGMDLEGGVGEFSVPFFRYPKYRCRYMLCVEGVG